MGILSIIFVDNHDNSFCESQDYYHDYSIEANTI